MTSPKNSMPAHVTEHHLRPPRREGAEPGLHRAGAGDPVVFLHGVGQLVWTPLLEALAKGHTPCTRPSTLGRTRPTSSTCGTCGISPLY